MKRRPRIRALRLSLWIIALVAAVFYRVWSDWDGADGSAALALAQRPASAAEWQRPIDQLGHDHLAKRVPWRFLRADQECTYAGELVWWHDGEEHVSYLAAPGEEPRQAFLELIGDIRHGRGPGQPPPTMLIPVGDPNLEQRLLTVASEEAPPADWTVLTEPVAE